MQRFTPAILITIVLISILTLFNATAQTESEPAKAATYTVVHYLPEGEVTYKPDRMLLDQGRVVLYFDDSNEKLYLYGNIKVTKVE